jgi:hypothetical protein
MSLRDHVTRGMGVRRWRRFGWRGYLLAALVGVSIGAVGRSLGQDRGSAETCSTNLPSDSLPEFAKKCDAAIGESVPAFDCDDGTQVPENHLTGTYPNAFCDAPNVLNAECDPGSRFQVLKETSKVAIVGHCRKKGNAAHQYGDIAVIQYNKANGAVCFYQALGTLPAKVTAPSQGNGGGNFPWIDPAGVASINCVRCHDNGPFIRSEYLAQLRNEVKNRLPGTNPGLGTWDQRFSWNLTLPMSFVGNDFQTWKTYSLSISGSGSGCLGCHRLGFSESNGSFNSGDGTAQNFAIIATAMSQAHKNPHSADSPIWMTPGQITYSAANDTEAHAAAACAAALGQKLHDPNAPAPPQGCQYAQFGRGNTCTGGPITAVINGATQSTPTGGRSDTTVTLGSCSDPSNCPPGLCYWRTVHGPFWQTTPFAIPVADAQYRGSFVRIFGENGLWKSRAFSDTTGMPPNAPPGGTVECTNYNEISAVPDVSKCFANQFAVVDKDGTAASGTTDATVQATTTANALTGYIGNIAQSNISRRRDQPDTLRVFASGSNILLRQLHNTSPPSPLKIGPLKGESWTNGCVSWTANLLAKDVFTETDVKLLDPAQTSNARCYVTGVTGGWSSTRNNASVQPFAEIYVAANKETHLRVSPTGGGDRVGAYASCFQLK